MKGDGDRRRGKRGTTDETARERPRPRIAPSHTRGRKAGGRRAGPGAAALPVPRRAAADEAAPRRGAGAEATGRAEARPAVAAAVEGPPDAARALALVIAGAALERQAERIEIVDVTGKVDYADYLILMSGRSDRHVAALAEAIEKAVEAGKKRPLSVEGLQAGRWVLQDWGDVVVHIFQEEARALYDIEGLWMDARRLPLPEGSGEGARAR